jgi:hypothetical protein
VKEGALFEFLHEEGAHLRRGVHHHLGGGFLERRRLLQWARQRQGKFKGQARAKSRQRHQDKDKGKQRKKGTLRQGVPYFTRLVGRSSRNSKASESGCYCTKFTCICFICCKFFCEAFYIYLLQTSFPHGGGFQGHVDQKHMCQFHACLKV